MESHVLRGSTERECRVNECSRLLFDRVRVFSGEKNGHFCFLRHLSGKKGRILHVLCFLGNFYCLGRALSFACQAFDAVLFSHWVRLLVGSRMAGCVGPVKKGYGAHFYAYAVSCAHVPVHCNVGSMYAAFFWRFDGSPDVVALMLTSDLAVFLEVGVNWQNLFTHSLGLTVKILSLLCTCS